MANALAHFSRKPKILLIKTPWFYGWNILFASVLFQALTWGLAATFTLFVPGWMLAFHATRAEIMLAILLEMVAVGALAPIVGRFLDRTPSGLIVIVGGISFACGLLLIGASTQLWQILVAYAALLSLGKSLAGPLTGSTLAAKWFDRRRGLALGISATGTAVGSVMLVPLAAVLLAHIGWRSAHVALAALCALVLIPLGAFVIRSSPKSAGVEPEPGHAKLQPLRPLQRKWTTLEILRSPVLWIIVLTILPFNIITSAVQSNLGPFMMDLGFDVQRAGQLIPIIAAFTVAGKITLGTLADRVDIRILLIVATLFVGVALAIMRISPSIPMLYLSAVLLGFGSGTPLPLIGMIVSKHFDHESFGRVTGVCFFFVLAFSGSGAVIGGYIRDVTGSYTAMFGTLIIVLIPIVLAASFLRPPKESESPRDTPHEDLPDDVQRGARRRA